jgi:hypothetical protein
MGNTGSAFDMNRGAVFKHHRMQDKLITISIATTDAFQIELQVALHLQYWLAVAWMEKYEVAELPSFTYGSERSSKGCATPCERLSWVL